MNYEKSCGAVVFRRLNGGIVYLIVLNRKGDSIGHWGFPKGHIETGETELETAAREILEETGLRVNFIEGFRYVVNYSPRAGVNKDAVYFLAQSKESKVVIQKSEIASYRWLSYNNAIKKLDHDNDVLKAAHEFLLKI